MIALMCFQILVEASSGVVTRQRAATNERNQQSTASSSSATGGTTEIVLQHPLGRPENDDSEENAKGVTTNFESEK